MENTFFVVFCIVSPNPNDIPIPLPSSTGC